MEERVGEGNGLLRELDRILSSDCQIDEVGFVHPSQLTSLHADHPSDADPASFWHGDRKVAISMDAIVPLFKAAKAALMPSRQVLLECIQASKSCISEEFRLLTNKLLSCTRAAILTNPGFKMAWDVRKQIFVLLAGVDPLEELHLCRLALCINPKCEEAWAHRRWTIGSRDQLSSHQISERLLEEEFELVAIIADRSRMNYRAWRHCCWLVQWMSSSQVLHALQRWKKWAELHAAESSCFQFRRSLFEKLLSDKKRLVEGRNAWLEELEWNKNLIKFYIGREALWLHRRYLFFIWVEHFEHAQSSESMKHLLPFRDAEIAFANKCIANCNDDGTQDFQQQIVYAATFKLWVLLKCNETSPSLSTVTVQSDELLDTELQLMCKSSHQKALWECLLKGFKA